MLGFLVILSGLVAVQGRPAKVYEAPIDDAYSVRATVSHSIKSPGVCCTSLFRLLLVDRADASRYWELAAVSEAYEYRYFVRRATSSSVIIERADSDYGISYGFLALFFDVRSKALLKRIDFKPSEAVKSIELEEVRRVGLDAVVFAQIKGAPSPRTQDDVTLPEVLQGVALPQSTYQEFAKARPSRARNGYREDVARIEEKIGASQVLDGRVWFGKTFYDGEGSTGVGGLGYFDVIRKQFAFLRIPEVVDWSVSTLLVKDQVLWAGLEGRPEAAEYSGGLLRHDLRTSATRIYRVEDVITSLHPSGDELVIGTTNGIYVLRGDRLIRHRITPTLQGKFVFYTDTL